jgi:hypothetical protein
MPARRRHLLLCLALTGAPANAQTIAVSPRPDRVAVTVYRDPYRPAEQQPNLGWLNGYALITETRTVTLAAGESEIRFEGVAGGILPQSAIVSGFPSGIVERNRDAYLLSPATLLDRSLGARVHLRRTSRATGRVREQDAIVRSGADGAVVIETEGGLESLRCTGLRETVTYDGVPPGLSARPTLSVRARAQRPVQAAVTLSYLATGFDWQADYVANLSPDGTRLDLFAWLTLANGDETGFPAADTQAVAGQLNRGYARAQPSEGGPLTLRCWPQDTTSDIPEDDGYEEVAVGGVFADGMAMAPPPPPPPPPPPAPPVVDAAMVAEQEELGDLKLYRIPEPVTVAARSQKQVALLQRTGVQVRTVYRYRFSLTGSAGGVRRLLVSRNRAEEGLGLPLPAGRLLLFDGSGPRPLLVGRATLRDRAVGEDVEIDLGEAGGVRAAARVLAQTEETFDNELVITNDRAEPIAFEAEIVPLNLVLTSETPLAARNGARLWAVTVPANGSATLRYRFAFPRPYEGSTR